MIRELLICVFLLFGSLLMLLAGVGLIRFSDTLGRAHALAKASTCGICSLLIGLWISLTDQASALNILLVITFILLTFPISGHLVAFLMYHHEKRDENSKDE